MVGGTITVVTHLIETQLKYTIKSPVLVPHFLKLNWRFNYKNNPQKQKFDGSVSEGFP